MKITWLGHSCFKIQLKNSSILIDPYDQKIGLKPVNTKADIVLVTHDHYDHNSTEGITAETDPAQKPYIITNPGEYEIHEVMVQGVQAAHDNKAGAERGLVTMYNIQAEGISIAHVGDLGQMLTSAQTDLLGKVDILLVPVGGNFTINAKEAIEVVNEIEPRIVIPMHYQIPGLTVEINSAEEFLKEMGAKETVPQDSLKITKKELPQEETQVVVLQPLRAK